MNLIALYMIYFITQYSLMKRFMTYLKEQFHNISTIKITSFGYITEEFDSSLFTETFLVGDRIHKNIVSSTSARSF